MLQIDACNKLFYLNITLVIQALLVCDAIYELKLNKFMDYVNNK
jgi:hypothetical protein